MLNRNSFSYTLIVINKFCVETFNLQEISSTLYIFSNKIRGRRGGFLSYSKNTDYLRYKTRTTVGQTSSIMIKFKNKFSSKKGLCYDKKEDAL